MLDELITVPTMEFVGALNDVIPFASKEKDDPAYGIVRIECDGDDVITLASNRNQHVRYFWDPNTVEIRESRPFSIGIDLADAVNLARTFKLPTKLSWAPLHIGTSVDDFEENSYRLRVWRDGGEDWSKISQDVTGRGRPRPETKDIPEPNIHGLIRDFADRESHLEKIAFSGDRLANFGKVRAHGPVEFEFSGEAHQAVRVTVGPRFAGVVWPVKMDPEA
jgi:hypothetical protein